MPGIEKSRFTNVSEIEDELLCNICEAIFVDPVVTPCCEQTYCKTCIKNWIKERKTCPNDKKPLIESKLTQPPRLVFNLLNRLKIKCDFQLNGCNEEIIFSRYRQHVKECPFNPLAKCADCGESNGERDGHNCVVILVAKNKSLEISNKKCERERMKLKKKLAENTEKLMEKNDQLSEANNELEAIHKELTQSNEMLEESECLNKSVNELNELYMSAKELESENTVKELREKLHNKNNSLEKFKNFIRELNEENQKLAKEKRVFNQNIFTEFEKHITELKNYVLKIENTFCELKNRMKTQTEHNYVNLIEEKAGKYKNYILKQENITLTSLYLNGWNSDSFTMNGFQWKIRIIKEANSDYLSFYLVCNGDEESTDYSCNATVEFKVIQQIENRNYYALKCEHLFTNKENICGFSKFMPWSIISDNEIGYIKDGYISLEVFVRCGQKKSSDESEIVSLTEQIWENVGEAGTSSNSGKSGVVNIDLNDI